jgi:hypothetical protein
MDRIQPEKVVDFMNKLEEAKYEIFPMPKDVEEWKVRSEHANAGCRSIRGDEEGRIRTKSRLHIYRRQS